MATFTSAWVERPGQITYLEQEKPQPSAMEVLVRIKACGICGTDIHFYHDLPEKTRTPLGHEVAGVVEAVGTGVSHVSVGESVVVQNHVPCYRCEACLNQRYDACSDMQTYMDRWAGMAEYLVVPHTMVIGFEGLGFAEATLAEPVTVALDLCREASVRMLDSVLIMGPGTIGLSCVPIVRKQGAGAIVVAGHHLGTVRGNYRSKVALALGADLVVDTAHPGWKDLLHKRFPKLFDRVIVTSPPNTLSDGIALAGFRGCIVYDGISYTDDTVSFSANDFHFKKKRLFASHAIPNWGFPQAFTLLRERIIPADSLLTHRYGFKDIAQALEDYKATDREIIKSVVEIP